MNTIKVFLIMFIVFCIINWITLKTPMAIFMSFDNLSSFGSFFNPKGLLVDSKQLGYTDNNIFISNIYGGEIIGTVDKFVSNFQTGQGLKDVNNWIKRLDQNVLKNALDLMGGDNQDNRILLYLLNSPFKINGISYDLIQIKNIPSDWMINNLVINTQGSLCFKTTWYSTSPETFIRALQISIKITLIIIASVTLTSTTTPGELTSGIEKLFSPLKILRFPANECALILSIGIRFIPSLLSESKRILNAQAARGLDYYNGNIFTKLKSLVSLIIPLFSISIRKSDDLASAMEARGYDPRATRTEFKPQHMTIFDYFYLGITTLLLSFIIFMWIYQIIFLPFGIIEGVLVL